MSRRVFIVAAETSGDVLGGELIEALRRRDRELVFGAIGGAAMAAQGAPSLFDTSALAVLGLIEGVQAYPRVVKLADQAAAGIAAFKPDAVVLIDSWGFTLRVAQRLGPLLPHTPLVKYIGPQVWAYRAGRAKTLAEAVDHLICIYEFERPYYAPFGLACTVSGHPAFGRSRAGDGAAFRNRHAIAAETRVLLLLPGSRPAEIARVAPALERAAAMLCSTRPDLVVVTVVAENVRAAVHDRAAAWRFPHVLVDDVAQKTDAFASATAALAVSGTVATEIALQSVPVVIGYKLGWVTWALLSLQFKPRYITLFNIAADAQAAPEFVQARLTPENVAAAAAPLLDDPDARAAQVSAQNQALQAMSRAGAPAAEIAADAVLDVLNRGASAVRRRSRG